jgi:hypothetical protein
MAKMSDSELASLVDQQIQQAISYDRSDMATQRRRAFEYRNGEMLDFPTPPGKSSVVSRDVNDTIGWIAPSMARVFLSSDTIGTYEPQTPQDEEFAKQATDYINFVLMRDCNGYQVINDALDDGLLLANGILKHWWDDTPVYRTERFSNLSDEQILLLTSDPELEIVEQEEKPSLEGLVLYDVVAKRVTMKGRLRVMCLPSEEFLIERDATKLDEENCRFCGHRYTATRSDLVKQGYKKDKVYSLSTSNAFDEASERSARDPSAGGWRGTDPDKSTEKVDVYECYIQIDYDGDGVSELRKVVMAGGFGERNMLENEEWGDDLPFSDLVPMPIPHRWRGRSIYDEAKDVQDVKTVLLRKGLDNIYQVVEPGEAVNVDLIEDFDEVLDRAAGRTVRTRGAGAIEQLETPLIADKAVDFMRYMDEVLEKRTGVSRSSMALDPEALSNQTATGVEAGQAAAMSKIELYARNIAENGMTRLFRQLLKLIVKHQDRPRTIMLRDKWVEMDPRAWNADMNVSINTGLGSGSRKSDVQMLTGIIADQKEAIMAMGPDNPLASLVELRAALAKRAEVAGVKNTTQFYKELTTDGLQQYLQQQSQAAQQRPDPKMMEAQAKAQLAQMTAQADAELAQQRAAAELELSRQRSGAEIEAMREKHMFEMQATREKNEMQLALEREKANQTFELRQREMMIEAELTAQANAMNAQVAMRQADTNINRPGGE